MRTTSYLTVAGLVLLVGLANAEPPLRGWISFPGTKWCGPGKTAQNYEDLGTSVEADMCCRDHDNCPEKILHNESKYGLLNDASYTVSHCDCDHEFFKCLKAAPTKTSSFIGFTFFSVVNPRCFKEDYPANCIKYSFSGRRCVEWVKDTSKPKKWQFFDNETW